MSDREAQNLARIRKAIKASATRATIATINRDTGLAHTLIKRLVQKHHLRVVWRARDTIEAESRDYCDEIEKFQGFCSDRQKNFRRCMIAALRTFMRNHA